MKLLLTIILLLFVPSVYADTPDISIVNTIVHSMSMASGKLITQAITWLSAFMFIQFVLTNIQLIKNDGDITTVIGKLMGSMLWFGFCAYLIQNGPDFIDSVGNSMFNNFAPNIPSPGSVITSTLAICSLLLAAIAVVGSSVAGFSNSSLGLVLVDVLIVVFAIGMFMAIKLIMIQLELGLVVMLSPLSFAFLGLNALKDQGIAPFKSLISLAYRIILLGIVYTAFGNVMDIMANALGNIHWVNPTSWGDSVKVIFASLASFPMIAFLVYKSDAIASSLASGGTSLGTADVASAAAAGAAMGAAVGAGSAATVGAANNGSNAVGDVLKNLMGGNSGSISNASGTGLGGGRDAKPIGTAPAASLKTPEPSLQSLQSDPSHPSQQSGSGSGATTGSPATAAQKIDSMIANGEATNPAAAGAVSAHLKSMNSGSSGSSEVPANSSPSTGSGSSAAIGGASSPTEEKFDKLMDVLSNQGSNKPSLGDRLSTANDHVSRESAATHVNISTHHSD
jgi:type IV secretion system protein TrbL